MKDDAGAQTHWVIPAETAVAVCSLTSLSNKLGLYSPSCTPTTRTQTAEHQTTTLSYSIQGVLEFNLFHSANKSL